METLLCIFKQQNKLIICQERFSTSCRWFFFRSLPSFQDSHLIPSVVSHFKSIHFVQNNKSQLSLWMCHTFPISQGCRLIRQRAAPSSPTRGPQGRRPHRARRAFRPVPSCPASPRQTSPCPRRAAPASATACATTLTPTLPPPRRVRSTYACKATGTHNPTLLPSLLVSQASHNLRCKDAEMC